MLAFLQTTERVIIVILIILMLVAVALATIELGWLIVKDVVTPPIVLLEIDELLDIFGSFLLVMIGVELLYILRTHLTNHVIHAEVVVEVAVIAVARKVIILDLKENPALTLVGIAAIIVALAAVMFALRRWRTGRPADGGRKPEAPESPPGSTAIRT